MVTLEELRDEYRRAGIDGLLQSLLDKVVWSTVRQYPPIEYSPYRVWDRSACEDVLNDWVLERLWGRADLQAMLASASTLGQLRAALTTSLRQHLTNKRRRSIASNLYKRARAMMRDDSAFRPHGPETLGAEQRWTLVLSGSSEPSRLSIGDLVEVACQLSDDDLDIVRYGPFSQKLSPILREPNLRQFLLHLLGHSEGSLSLGAIVEVMRLRFSLPTEEHVELTNAIPSPTPDPDDEAAASATARSVVSRLDLSEAHVLAAYFSAEGRIAEAADSSGSSVERVRQVVHGVFEMLCDSSASLEAARAAMKKVESLLLKGGD